MREAQPIDIAINPDDYLETCDGRIWTVERDAKAWALAYEALTDALTNRDKPSRVIIVCGIQGSGKTTWIENQRSRIRSIYFDAALPGVRHRAKIIAIARQFGVTVEAVWIKVPLEVALARNARRSADKQVPVAAIHSVAKQFEEPAASEGFETVTVVDGGYSNVRH